MKPLSLLIAVVSMALVAALVWWEWNNRRSPGPLHPSHAAIAALSDANSCSSCHGDKTTTMQQACLSCHSDVHEQVKQKSSLHGRMSADLLKHCDKCHTDHTGPRVAMVSPRSFQLAGIDRVEKIDHNQFVKFALDGKHLEVQCATCHPKFNRPYMNKGERRYMGIKQDCQSCHEDVHKGIYGPDCLGCHGQAHEFKRADGFVHTDKFPLKQVHDIKPCSKCHEKTGGTSVAVLYHQPINVRTCVACHKDVHEGAMGADCISCHGLSRPFDQVEKYKHTQDFPLIASHGHSSCKSCHEKSGLNSVAALRQKPQPVRACTVCHTSPHSSQLVAFVSASIKKPQGQTCEACHSVQNKTWSPPEVQMPLNLHAGTGFLLTLPHEKVKCESCHEQFGKRLPLDRKSPAFASQFAAFYPGRAMQTCESCHKDPHGGQFVDAKGKATCISCHASTHFAPNTFDLARHDKTQFPLTGSHRAVACVMCHKKDEKNVVAFKSTASRCIECHKDVHEGKFDLPGRPKIVDNRTDCARCHNTSSFATFNWTGQDHAIWTGFKLLGKHEKASCVACHGQRAPDSTGKKLGEAPKLCASCHSDIHGGQFITAGKNDCARCHAESAGSFKETIFNHQRDSKFALDKQHINLKCAQCHLGYVIDKKTTIVRYKPLKSECKDCHGVMDVKQRGDK